MSSEAALAMAAAALLLSVLLGLGLYAVRTLGTAEKAARDAVAVPARQAAEPVCPSHLPLTELRAPLTVSGKLSAVPQDQCACRRLLQGGAQPQAACRIACGGGEMQQPEPLLPPRQPRQQTAPVAQRGRRHALRAELLCCMPRCRPLRPLPATSLAAPTLEPGRCRVRKMMLSL